MTGSFAIRPSSRMLLIIAVLAASFLAGLSFQRAAAQPAPLPIDTLCANKWTGAISVPFTGCPPGTQPIDLTAGEVDVCVSAYTGALSLAPAGGCVAGRYPLTLAGDQPVTLCANRYTGAARYPPAGGCLAGEQAVVVEPAIVQAVFDCGADGDCPRPLPEVTGTEGSVTSFLAVNDPGGGQITDVNVYVSFSHAFVSDLDVFLESPGGTVVELFTDVCPDEGDLAVTLDDGAGSPITTIACAAQMSGTFQPEGSLSDFNTETATGTWELQITDDADGDAGLLWDWTLEITTDQGALPDATCTDCLVLIPGTGAGGDQGVAVSQLPVNPPAGSQIADLNLTVDISHTALVDLHIYLRSPAGTVVKVFDQLCGTDDDLEVVYDDEAAGGLNCANRLGFNSFQPAPGSLSAVDGEDAAGTWLLVILDDASIDTGTLDNWALDFTFS